MNNHNTNKNIINDILSSGKVNINDAKKAIDSKDPSKLINNLSQEDKKKLNDILNDKNSLEQVLKSPQAQALMKLFNKK